MPGPFASDTAALLYDLDLKSKCFRKFSTVLVGVIRKCDCIFTSLSVLFLPSLWQHRYSGSGATPLLSLHPNSCLPWPTPCRLTELHFPTCGMGPRAVAATAALGDAAPHTSGAVSEHSVLPSDSRELSLPSALVFTLNGGLEPEQGCLFCTGCHTPVPGRQPWGMLRDSSITGNAMAPATVLSVCLPEHLDFPDGGVHMCLLRPFCPSQITHQLTHHSSPITAHRMQASPTARQLHAEANQEG